MVVLKGTRPDWSARDLFRHIELETFAPAAKINSIEILLSVAVNFD